MTSDVDLYKFTFNAMPDLPLIQITVRKVNIIINE